MRAPSNRWVINLNRLKCVFRIKYADIPSKRLFSNLLLSYILYIVENSLLVNIDPKLLIVKRAALNVSSLHRYFIHRRVTIVSLGFLRWTCENYTCHLAWPQEKIAADRMILRYLLRYKGWMFEGRGQVSLFTRVWAALLTVFSKGGDFSFFNFIIKFWKVWPDFTLSKTTVHHCPFQN